MAQFLMRIAFDLIRTTHIQNYLTKKRTTTKLTTNLSRTVVFGDPDGSVVLDVLVLEVIGLEVIGVVNKSP